MLRLRLLDVKKTNVQAVLHLRFPIYSLCSCQLCLVPWQADAWAHSAGVPCLPAFDSMRPRSGGDWFVGEEVETGISPLASSFRGSQSVTGFYLVALSAHRSGQRQTSCPSRSTQIRKQLPALTSPRVFRSHCCCPCLCPLLGKQFLH